MCCATGTTCLAGVCATADEREIGIVEEKRVGTLYISFHLFSYYSTIRKQQQQGGVPYC